jgi:hypothetical protein
VTLQAPADSLRPVLDSVFSAPEYAWVTRVHPLQWLRDRFFELVAWFEALRLSAPLAYWAIVAVAVTLLVAILVHGGWLMARSMRSATPPDAREGSIRAARRDGAWYREQAARAAGAGRYAEAMRAYFEGLILDLAAAGAVAWHPSKTPREYVREAKVSPAERGALAELVDQVYDASFAGAVWGRLEWEAWRARAAGGWRER